jgi:outer membrane protein, multidrug efflux system
MPEFRFGASTRRQAATAPWPFVLLILSGCAAGPNYQPPMAAVPAAYSNADAAAGVVASPDEAALAVFWQQFQDPVLDRLMQQAWAANLDVRIAQARLIEARAALWGAEAQSLPSLGLEAAASRTLSPQWQQPGASRGQRTGSVFAPSAVMNWELDLFGRLQRGTESAAATVSAQELGVAGAQVALAGAVAANYLALRGLQQRLVVAQESLSNQSEALRLTEVRLAAGRGTPFDVARARNLVASTAAGIPALQLQLTRTVQRLATLTNQPGAEVANALRAAQPLPRLPVTDVAQWPVGTPAELLRRRPDIRVAERQLAASSADIGVALAERFPRLSISGLLGLNSNRAADLSSSGAAVYSLGAALSWTAFDFGRIDARIKASEASSQRSLLVYQQTVLTALEETETALSTFTRTAQQAAELAVAARSAQEAADIARKRYAAGSIDPLALLDAERQVLSARDSLAQSDTGTATALVDVYRALGGGWRVTPPSPIH